MSQFEHGWLLPELLRLDQQYHGRFERWEHTLKAGEAIAPAPIKFLGLADEGFSKCLEMVMGCLQSIPKHWECANYRLIPYFAEWLLFALGHPSQRQLPGEPSGCQGASDRLRQSLDLEILIQYPADYLGHLLASENYGKWGSGQFYPTWQPTAQLMAEMGAHTNRLMSHLPPPYHGFDPCLGTGRLSLELSNHCRALTGWERDAFLMQISLLHFMLYAPDFALPIPMLGGDLIRGDALTGEGRSIICPKRVYQQCPVTLLPDPSPIIPSIAEERAVAESMMYVQGTLF